MNIENRMQKSKIEQLQKKVPELRISQEGQFKYILIKCKIGGQTGTFVRGDKKYEYHSENYDQFYKELKKCGVTGLKKNQERITGTFEGEKVDFLCPGGGRIEHNYQGIKCSIYGYSQSYGYVDHREAQKIISRQLGYPINQILLDQKQY